jgi:hypothetical protein
VELEVGAVAERFESENLKPLQFKQRELLGKNRGQFSVTSCQLCLGAGCLPDGYPHRRNGASQIVSVTISVPGWFGRAQI